MSKTYKHIGYDDIINVSVRSGSPADRIGTNLMPSNIDIVRDGDVLGCLFNGTDSVLATGLGHTLIGDLTCIAWVKPYSFGEGGEGIIFDGGQLTIYVRSTNSAYAVSSDGGGTVIESAAGTVVFDKWQLIVVTRTAAGLANIYLDSVLSGAADQDSGTPGFNGSVRFGNNVAGDATFEGLQEAWRIRSVILPLAEIMQVYTNERARYENH